jgi:hypothetical protein
VAAGLMAVIATLGAAPADTRIAKSILVTVLNEKGDPIRDLEPREFIVTEDGTQRQIIDARANREPLFVALLVDTARAHPGVPYPTQDLRRGLAAFNRRILNGTAGSQIVVYDIAQGGSVVVPYTSVAEPLNTWSRRLVESPQGAGVLLEAMVAASRDLATKPSPRRAIVSITFDSPESSRLTPQSVADEVVKSGAAYWPISIRGSGLFISTPVPLRETLFSNLPGPTGGLQVTAVSTTALEQILSRVAAALTSQYEVTYYRPEGVPARDIQASAKRGVKFLRASWIR